MRAWDRNHLRHVFMRLALAFVLGWFGVQELRNPADWAVFVPNVVASHAPVAVNDLIVLHGFLLVLAAVAVAGGLFYAIGAVLAAALLAEVVLGLWIDSGFSDLVVRDIGLLGLAVAGALDPVRAWQLDDALVRRRPANQAAKRKKGDRQAAAPSAVAWQVRAGSGAVLLLVVLSVAFVLRATGSSRLASTGVASLYANQPPATSAAQSAQSSQPPAAQPTSPAEQPSPAPAQPSPAAPTSQAPAANAIRFADWRYRRDSFQVYPGEINSDTRDALAGFDLSVQDQGSTVLLVFRALSSRYHDATISVDKGNTAYFIETSMRDDPSAQEENNLNDDGVVVVDAQGYIIQS